MISISKSGIAISSFRDKTTLENIFSLIAFTALATKSSKKSLLIALFIVEVFFSKK